MEGSQLDTETSVVKFVAGLVAAVVVAMGGVGYAVHEHHAAQEAAAQSQQASAELAQTRSQLNNLTAKVSELVTQQQAQQAAAQQAAATAAAEAPVRRAAGKPRAGHAAEARWKKMQAQLDAQGKAIDETRGDLASAKTELTGSIAKTHDELVTLEKRGERSYFEFDLQKSKQFTREGPLGVSLRKANVKHQFADLQLMVDDRNLVQKHVNLDQPVMYYQPDTEQPIQVVINSITKDHIHGYVSAPKYRKSELASMAGGDANGANAQNESDGIVGDSQTAPRKRLTVPPPQ
ncbi:MAG: hypothetical protein ACLGXA_05800 [Acidobacteriota bacterium]